MDNILFSFVQINSGIIDNYYALLFFVLISTNKIKQCAHDRLFSQLSYTQLPLPIIVLHTIVFSHNCLTHNCLRTTVLHTIVINPNLAVFLMRS